MILSFKGGFAGFEAALLFTLFPDFMLTLCFINAVKISIGLCHNRKTS